MARGGVQAGEEVVPPPGVMRDQPEMRPPFGAHVRVHGEGLRHFDAALAECADELVRLTDDRLPPPQRRQDTPEHQSTRPDFPCG